MLRVNFTDTDSSNSYTVPYNPVSVELLQNVNRSVISDINAYSVLRTSTVDNRVRSLQWASYETSTAFDAMVVKLKSYVGRIKIIDFQDFDYNSLGTQTIKVLNVRKVIQNTFKGLRYSLALDFVFQNAIITETLPPDPAPAATTLSELTTTLTNPSSAVILNIAADDTNYNSLYTEGGEPTASYRWHDQTGNDYHWGQRGSNACPIRKEDDSSINSRSYLDFVQNTKRHYQNEVVYTTDNWSDFMCDMETTGWTMLCMLNPTVGADEGSENLKAIFDNAFAMTQSSLRGVFLRWQTVNFTGGDNERMAFFSPSAGAGYYWTGTNDSSPVGSFASDTWYFMVIRVTWGNGAIGNATLEFFNGLGVSSSATNAATITASQTHATQTPILGGANNATWAANSRHFSGKMSLFGIYNAPLSNADINTILTDVNSYYSTSFSLT